MAERTVIEALDGPVLTVIIPVPCCKCLGVGCELLLQPLAAAIPIAAADGR